MSDKPHYRRMASGQTIQVSDGLQSLATNLGTSSDKAATATYALRMLDANQLEVAFRSSWVMQKVVSVPSLDATRKWREWSGIDAQKIEDLEDVFEVKSKVNEAHMLSRLFGGACILIGAGNQDLVEPLDPASLRAGDLQYLTVIPRQGLTPDLVEIDPRRPRYGKPRQYTIQTNTGEIVRVHPTRMVEFTGVRRPTFGAVEAGAYGWGDSVLQACYEACRNLDATMANIASLVFDAKTDVVRLDGLIASISDPKFEEALLKRYSAARMLKGNYGTLLLDQKEDYQSKSYSFAGLDAVADRFMQVVAGAADIPMTRMLGRSPGGLNSTGDGDLSNYYDRIQAMQKVEIQPAMRVLDQVIVRSALGDWPKDVSFEWRPLKQMTEEEISTIRARDADTVSKLALSQVFADDAVADVGAQLFRETGVDGLDGGYAEGDVEPEKPEAGDLL